MKKEAIVLLSGGVDSTTLLAYVVDKFGADNVAALNITYGQKHVVEMTCAKKIADYYKVDYKVLDTSSIFEYSNCSLLNHSTDNVIHESYTDQLKESNGKPVSTYVPFRNGLFLSIAASFALSVQAENVYYGAHMDDSAGDAYPDCSNEFTIAMRNAIYIGSGKQVVIEGPFVKMNKAGIIALGKKLGVPYYLTWSCYDPIKKDDMYYPCGKCGTCIQRAEAFKANNLIDEMVTTGIKII